jgi:hypothetical protein
MIKHFYVCIIALFISNFLIAQSNNSYNYIGQKHNELLESASNETFENNTEMMNFLFEQMNSMGLSGSMTTEVAVEKLSILENCDYELNCFVEGALKDPLLSEVKDLISTLEGKETKAAFQSSVESYVSNIANNNSLSEVQKNAMLAFCATAYNSAEYWSGNNSLLQGRWIRIALFDAAGALIGFVAGGPWGAVGLGAACSIGAALTD